jgi:HEPN domain-containing protein
VPGILTSRDFQKAAEQRFTVAEFLLEKSDYTLDALYLAGYAAECILKALVMHLTPEPDREAAFLGLKKGARMHYPEHINEELKRLNCPIPGDLARGFRRFEWSTDLRYESGRRPGSEVRGFLKVARKTIDWVKGEMK